MTDDRRQMTEVRGQMKVAEGQQNTNVRLRAVKETYR